MGGDKNYLDPDSCPLEEDPGPGHDPEAEALEADPPVGADSEEFPLDGSLSLNDLVKSVFGNTENFGTDELAFRRSGDRIKILDSGKYREMTSEEKSELWSRLERFRGEGSD